MYVESFAVVWKMFEKSVSVLCESSRIGESFTDEKWFDKFSAEFPILSIDCVNAFVRKRMCGFIVSSHRTNGKIFPVDGRHGLHILGLNGVDKSTAHKVNQKRFGLILVNPIKPNKEIVLSQGLRHANGDIEAKERIQERISWNSAASQLLPLEVIVKKFIYFLRNEKNNGNIEGIRRPLPKGVHCIMRSKSNRLR